MNCPHCQKELPGQTAAMICPFCGKDCFVPAPVGPPKRNTIWLALVVLILPPVLILLVAMLGNAMGNAAAFIAFIGSGVAAIAGGQLVSIRFRCSVPWRVFWGIIIAIPLYAVCFFLCFAGCALGNNMRFRP